MRKTVYEYVYSSLINSSDYIVLKDTALEKPYDLAYSIR